MNDKATAKLLFRAIMRGQLKSVKILVDGGADVNAVDKDGQMPLMKAFEEISMSATDTASSRHQIVLYLIAKGADPNITDKTGRNVFHLPQIKQFPVLNDFSSRNKDECSCNIQLSSVHRKEGIQRLIKTCNSCKSCKPYADVLSYTYIPHVSSKTKKNHRDRSNTETSSLAKAEAINHNCTNRKRSNTDGKVRTLYAENNGHSIRKTGLCIEKAQGDNDQENEHKSLGLEEIEISFL